MQPIADYDEIRTRRTGLGEWLPHQHAESARRRRLPADGRTRPYALSRTPASVRTAAPEFGQHTEEVLLEAGFDWDQITALREAGAFGDLANVSG